MPTNPKSIRMSEDAQRLIGLLAAFEERPEGKIVEDALAAYVTMRSLAYGNVLPEARELVNAGPADVGDTVARMTGAIEQALTSGVRAMGAGGAKARLRERAAEREASPAG